MKGFKKSNASETSAARVVAIDWMRGFVMALMVVDHASIFFNAGRIASDSAASHVPGAVLPLDQFLTRWITHLCAPTFVFLAGTALALSVARRLGRGEGSARVDRDLLIRGVLVLGLDVFYVSSLAGHRIFQVLYAIGVSMILMVPLRRLPDGWLLAIAIGWFALGESVTSLFWGPGREASSLIVGLTVGRYVGPDAYAFYPAVPWLAMMVLGWVFGNHLLHARREEVQRTLVIGGVVGLVVFFAVRGFESYGNMFLQREDGSIAQWLHVSKYPPSLSFTALELGLMALGIASCASLESHVRPRRNGPMLVFGQTALFFYLVHLPLLGLADRVLGLEKAGLSQTYAVAAVALIVLYPLCRAYRTYKQAHPASWVRFV